MATGNFAQVSSYITNWDRDSLNRNETRCRDEWTKRKDVIYNRTKERKKTINIVIYLARRERRMFKKKGERECTRWKNDTMKGARIQG